MTEQEYNALPGIRASAIKAGAVSMKHMRARILGQQEEQTDAKAWGLIVHGAILEPERFWQGVTIWKGGLTKKGVLSMSKATSAYEQFEAESTAAGKTILTDSQRVTLEQCIDAVWCKPAIADLLQASEHEVCRQWKDTAYGDGKCRLDGLCPGKFWVEVKTTCADSLDRYARQHYQMGYDLQLGWYSLGAGVDLPCRLIIVSNGAVPDAVLFKPIAEHVLAAGREDAVEIARRYRACEAAGIFAGMDGGEDEVEFVPPTYSGVEQKVDMGDETTEGNGMP